jgi:hypothetical protein
MCLFSNKTEKNRKKPVETEEIRLTKFAEKPKVKCGTVLRTRMNIGDSAFEMNAILAGEAGQASDR